MTSPPSPPNRRRRRVVVAIAVLALMSAVSWWYWPRGDARFVGTWQVSISDGKTAVPVFKVTYFRNGTMSFDDPQQQKTWPFRGWRVEGPHLIWGSRLPLPDNQFSKRLIKQIRQLPGMGSCGWERAVDIVKLTDGEIHLVDPKEPGIEVLTRIPD